MQEFCHLLFFSALITYASLAPTPPNPGKPKLESFIKQALNLSHDITTNPREQRKMIVPDEYNREDPKCIQTNIKTFIDGLKNNGIIENLKNIAAHFNASCPSLDETSCTSYTADHEEFKAQLIQFLEEIPLSC